MLLASRSWYAPTLRRLYTTSTTQTRPPKTKTQCDLPKISTFRPEKLVHSDFTVFAGRKRSSFHTELSYNTPASTQKVKYTPNIHMTTLGYRTCATLKPNSTKGDVGLEIGSAKITESDKKHGAKRLVQVHVPFPESAQGFLYLHQPPPESGLPRSASSIRFRCTPSLVETSSSYIASLKTVEKVGEGKKSTRADPLILLPSSITNQEIYKAFEAGNDLTLPSDVPWSISIIDVVGRPYLTYVRKQLVADELFSESEMQEYEDFYKNTNINRQRNLLKALDDVFTVRFDRSNLMVWNTTEKVEQTKEAGQAVPRIKARPTVFKNVFVDQRPEYGNKLPYTGAAHARFELAPESNPSNPVLSLRVVKMTKSAKCVIPDYDGYIHMPKEGELVTLGPPDKPEPWTRQIDPSKYTQSAILSLVPGYVAPAGASASAELP